jgi:hypothetical protein
VSPTTLQFWWSPPAAAHGTITGYTLACAAQGISQTYAGTVLTATLNGLTTGIDYTFTIYATNASGNSPTQAFRTVHTSAAPQPVTTLTYTPTLNENTLSLTFNWTNPGDYASFYSYGLKLSRGTDFIHTGTSDYATTTFTATNLDPSFTYTFHIERGNDAGYSSVQTLTTTRSNSFDPKTISGYQAWFDANDVNGNGSVVPDGTVVSTWHDKFKMFHDAVANDTAITLQTDSIGRYLKFTGTSYLPINSSGFIENNSWTFFIVENGLGTGTLVGDYVGYYETGAGLYCGRGFESYYNIGLGSSLDQSNYSKLPVNIWCFSQQTLGRAIYWNKQLIASDGYPNGPGFLPTFSIGWYSGAQKYKGNMREIIMYNGTMTSDSRTAIMNYLYSKWMPIAEPAAPPSIPVPYGLTQWLDAADINTLFTDLSGTSVIPIFGTGTPVGCWKDKSGNGNHVYQQQINAPMQNSLDGPGGAASIATYRPTKMNGLPCVDLLTNEAYFLNQNYILLESVPILKSPDATIFTVVKHTPFTTINDGFIFSHSTNNNCVDITLRTSNNTNFVNLLINADPYATRLPYETLQPSIYVGTLKAGQILSLTTIDISGTATVSSSVALPSVTGGFAPICIGNAASFDRPCNSYISEIIYYQRVLTPTEIATMTTYLEDKWNIHPATPFNMSQGLQLWLDSSDELTTFQNGGVLTAWKDKSDKGNNPTLIGAPDISGGIILNGTTKYLTLPDGTLPRSDYSYFIVADISDNSGNVLVSGGTLGPQPGQGFLISLGSSIKYSSDGQTWYDSSANGFISSPQAVASNGSSWVISSNGGQGGYSTDGINWIHITDASFNTLIPTCITWTGAHWIAGTATYPLLSTDGLHWTQGQVSVSPFLANAIATSGVLTVIVGASGSTGKSMSSTHGAPWENTTMPIDSILTDPITCVATVNTIWVAGDSGGHIAYYSGSSWTLAAGSGILRHILCITHNDSIFVIGGSGYFANILYSTDGNNWTATSDISTAISQVVWTGTVFLAYSTNQTYSSKDGINWSISTSLSGVSALAVGSGPTQTDGRFSIRKGVRQNMFIAVGPNPYYLYSSDGINWSPSSGNNIFYNYPYTVAWNGTMWLTGGYGANSIGYSYDGMNWTPAVSANSILSTICNTLAWNGTMWVAGGQGARLAYSYDGIIWNQAGVSDVMLGGCNTVVWNGSIWVAGGQAANPLAYSYDGITWLPSANGTNIFSAICASLAWNGTVWVAGGQGTNSIAYSSDGINWTGSSSGNTILVFGCYAVAWNGTVFVAGGQAVNPLAYSYDGITWLPSANGTNIFSASCVSLAWNGTVWVAGGQGTNSIAYSSDGITWTASTNSLPNCFGIGWGGQVLGTISTNLGITKLTGSLHIPETTSIIESVYGGRFAKQYIDGIKDSSQSLGTPILAGGAGNYNKISYSYDGINWRAVINDPFIAGAYGGQCNGFAWNGTLWVAAGGTAGGFVSTGYSYDGITWVAGGNTSYTNPFYSGVAYDIAWNGSYFIMVGSANYSVAKSSDGKIWESIPVSCIPFVSFNFQALNSVAWNGSYWIAVGFDYAQTLSVIKSTDGVNWIPATNNPFPGGQGSRVAWNGSYWIVTGNSLLNGNSDKVVAAISHDGMIWTPLKTPFDYYAAQDIKWNGSYWLMTAARLITTATPITTGYYYQIAKSYDGLAWTLCETYTDPLVYVSLIWTGDYWVANYGNQTMTSYDGNYWVGNAGNTGIQYAVRMGIRSDYRPQTLTSNSITIKGTLKEMMVYNTALTLSQRQQVELYLKSKWYPLKYDPTFAPGTIGLWLDAHPDNLIFGSGKHIQTWKDKSGRHVDCSQNNPVCQPIYDLDPATGRHGVIFGSEGYASGLLNNIISPFANSNSWTIMAVARFNNTVIGHVYRLNSDSPNMNLLRVINGNTLEAYVSNNENNVAIPGGPNSMFMFSENVNLSNYTVSVNGSAFGGGGGAAVMNYSDLESSTDGTTWKKTDPNVFDGGAIFSLVWNGSYWLASGTNANNTVSFAKSTDAITWTSALNNPFGQAAAAAWNGTQWIATGYNGIHTTVLASSTDGLTWTALSAMPFYHGQCIAWNGSYWVAGGRTAGGGDINSIAMSTDGTTWQSPTSNDLNTSCTGVAWNGSYWLAVGQNSDSSVSMVKSTDGLIWTNVSAVSSAVTNLTSIGWGGNHWVTAGFSGSTPTILRSYDETSTTWFPTSSYLPNTFTGSCLLWTGSSWYVGGGYPMKSTDGLGWTSVSTDLTLVNTIATNGSLLLIGGPSNRGPYLNIGFSGGWPMSSNIQEGEALIGTIYELIVMKNGLSLAEQQKMEGYLAWKWGIQLQLPTTHPYYTHAPVIYAPTPILG